jgi:hypothetical protein
LSPSPTCFCPGCCSDEAELERRVFLEPLHWWREAARFVWSDPEDGSKLLTKLAKVAGSAQQAALSGDLQSVAALAQSYCGQPARAAAGGVPAELVEALSKVLSHKEQISLMAMVGRGHTPACFITAVVGQRTVARRPPAMPSSVPPTCW